MTVPQAMVLTGVVLLLASATFLKVLPVDRLMSIDGDFLSWFLRPGVIAWWLVLAQPNSFAPASLGEVAFTAIANGALWLLAFLFIGAVGRDRVTRWWYVLAAPALVTASAAALALLVSRETIPSVVRGPFAMFAEPGVSIWWLLLGRLFDYYPKSFASLTVAAVANAAFWLLLFGIVMAVVRLARRMLKVHLP